MDCRASIAKWLPPTDPILDKWLTDSSMLEKTMDQVTRDITRYLVDLVGTNTCGPTMLDDIANEVEILVRGCAFAIETRTHSIYKFKVDHLVKLLKRKLDLVAEFIRVLIYDIIDCKTDRFLRTIFRLVNAYNDMIEMQVPRGSIFHDDCRGTLNPMRRMSVTRLLQVLARNKAEEYCHELIDCLLANYRPDVEREDLKSPEISENSSIEIYRALTKHMTPPMANAPAPTKAIEASNAESVQALVNAQNEQAVGLVNAANDLSPWLLGPARAATLGDEARYDETRVRRVRRSAMKRVTDYYQQVAWSAVSGILDRVVLWWSPEALAARHSQGARHLKDWLHQFSQRIDVPPTVRPALQNLCDALGCHVTLTAWDQLFRLAYIRSTHRGSPAEGRQRDGRCTDCFRGTETTGQTFVELFRLLVTLGNECEIGGEWVVGAPLPQLPLSEQILVLHRLDHSARTVRLWAVREAKSIAHTWDLDAFFLLVKGDLRNCIEELAYLKLANHADALATEPVNVQVYVCTRMRMKIVSEVNANVRLLQDSPAECISAMARICRVVSLANLHTCFPRSCHYRRKNGGFAPVGPSVYVDAYFERVLLPILEVMEDREISSMILKIMCEAWLDYIYLHRVQFSEWGALQLLTDFARVSTWIAECSIISANVRNHLLKNEVLRRCEGVGRLLLRRPGEAVVMHERPVRDADDSDDSRESLGLERMPAEMYVPNQEQWLELRAPKRYSFCCTEL